MQRSDWIAGGTILLIAVCLGTADYFLSERPMQLALQNGTESSSSEMGQTQSTASSTPTVIKKGNSTKKHDGPDVLATVTGLGLAQTETKEASLLTLTAPKDVPVTTVVLLKNNDRALLFGWLTSDNVKDIFSGLKQALQEHFSGDVQDLVDETRTSTSGIPVDVLSFLDPAISAEKVVFFRIRTRLYELHIAKGNDDLVDQVMEALAK